MKNSFEDYNVNIFTENEGSYICHINFRFINNGIIYSSYFRLIREYGKVSLNSIIDVISDYITMKGL